MAFKTTGKTWKDFYNDTKYWPEDAYHEEQVCTVNGVEVSEEFSLESVADTDQLHFAEQGGVVYLPDGTNHTLQGYFRKWSREQDKVSFVVTCDREHAKELKTFILKNKGKIS